MIIEFIQLFTTLFMKPLRFCPLPLIKSLFHFDWLLDLQVLIIHFLRVLFNLSNHVFQIQVFANQPCLDFSELECLIAAIIVHSIFDKFDGLFHYNFDRCFDSKVYLLLNLTVQINEILLYALSLNILFKALIGIHLNKIFNL